MICIELTNELHIARVDILDRGYNLNFFISKISNLYIGLFSDIFFSLLSSRSLACDGYLYSKPKF